MAAEQSVTISIDTILHGVEVVIIPVAGWLIRGAWHEMKGLVRSVDKKIDKVDGKVDGLSTDLNDHKLATERRLARVEAKVSSVFPKPS